MKLASVIRRRHARLQQLQAESWAIGALLAAVEEGPRPDKTTTSTGRHMESTTISRRAPSGYDPGAGRGSYKRPGVPQALRGARDGNPGDDVVCSVGAPYAPYVRRWGYRVAEAATRGGLEALRGDQAQNVKEAMR